MKKPTPVLRDIEGESRWWLDLRHPWKLGQHTLKTPGVPELLPDAIWEAKERFDRLRAAADARSAQALLPIGGPTIRDVLKSRIDEREFSTEGGESWGGDCNKRILERWGSVPIAHFRGLQGYHHGRAWRDEMAAEPLSPRTRRNYLNELWGLLRYAVERECGWLDDVPRRPDPCLKGETLDQGSENWPTYTEAEFRRLRAGLFETHDHPGGLCHKIPDRAARLDYIERRRLYLSFAFYSGMREADLDALDDRSVAPDVGAYFRTGQKTRAKVAAFDMPEALALDVQAEVRRLGRPFRKGEAICGGPWRRASQTMQDTARRLQLPLPINIRSVTRRSCAEQYLMRGWTYQEVAHVLGQQSTAMLERVYMRIPPRFRSPVKVAWDRESTARLARGEAATGRASVLRIEPRRAARRLQSAGEE